MKVSSWFVKTEVIKLKASVIVILSTEYPNRPELALGNCKNVSCFLIIEDLVSELSKYQYEVSNFTIYYKFTIYISMLIMQFLEILNNVYLEYHSLT